MKWFRSVLKTTRSFCSQLMIFLKEIVKPRRFYRKMNEQTCEKTSTKNNKTIYLRWQATLVFVWKRVLTCWISQWPFFCTHPHLDQRRRRLHLSHRGRCCCVDAAVAAAIAAWSVSSFRNLQNPIFITAVNVAVYTQHRTMREQIT